MNRTLSPDTSDGNIEQQLTALGKTAPRVTPDHVLDVIKRECYFTAAQGAEGAGFVVPAKDPLRLLTICVLVLRNGFTVTGTSACAHPDTFDVEVGRKLARAKAIDQVWQLEGYLLKERLALKEAEAVDNHIHGEG